MTAEPVVSCCEIEIGSPLFEGELRLRDEVLRKPLGRPSSAGERERDLLGRHFVALASNEVIGCIGLYPEGAAARLRHLAVAPRVRRKGVGRRLVAFAESSGAEARVARLEVEARTDALPFYEACGYVAEGDVFIRHGVPHRLMRKSLTQGEGA
ncbi:MAG: GNAT family N-acetyltransferase [Pseudomonadota bacterium]|nr:GNAT family N-acetyltransferase [Pseudomonadota bacterium]